MEFAYMGLRVMLSHALRDSHKTYERRQLSMIDQWRRWGWALWRYKEEVEDVTEHGPEILHTGSTIVCSPAAYRVLMAASNG